MGVTIFPPRGVSVSWGHKKRDSGDTNIFFGRNLCHHLFYGVTTLFFLFPAVSLSICFFVFADDSSASPSTKDVLTSL